MIPLAPKIMTILQKYMLEPHTAISATTALRDLAIDGLDLPMIVLDIEDEFEVQIAYCDETDQTLTVGRLIALVAVGLAAKREQAMRPAARRPKRTWMSTGADR
ncbi:MAG: hypothetical protein WBP38_02670 [Hyphomicrobium sp.]|jgi:acyl carrier protein|nr:hypothetical protein [Hyphomicrobium sp.]